MTYLLIGIIAYLMFGLLLTSISTWLLNDRETQDLLESGIDNILTEQYNEYVSYYTEHPKLTFGLMVVFLPMFLVYEIVSGLFGFIVKFIKGKSL